MYLPVMGMFCQALNLFIKMITKIAQIQQDI